MFNLKFYRVGMISLLFLPMLFIPFVRKEFQKKDLRTLKLNLPIPNYDKKEAIPNFYNLDRWQKEIDFVEFNANNLSDLEIENYFKTLKNQSLNIEFLKNKSEDYKFGIKAKLDLTSTYATFIKLLNYSEKYKLSRKWFDIRYDEFYVFVEKKNPIKNYFESDVIIDMECGLINNTTLFEELKAYVEAKYYPIIESFDKTKYIFILYLTLIIITYFRLKK